MHIEGVHAGILQEQGFLKPWYPPLSLAIKDKIYPCLRLRSDIRKGYADEASVSRRYIIVQLVRTTDQKLPCGFQRIRLGIQGYAFAKHARFCHASTDDARLSHNL